MAIKKTELYSSLWKSCDELRGGMDASQYKDYILTLLFMKYVSDKYEGDPHAVLVVPKGGSFSDMVALKGKDEIGDKINKIIGRLAEENNLKGVIDVADFNDEDKLGKGKAMIDRLSALVGIFEGLDLGANRAEGDDLLGDAYEYLMRHFATESGKSKGQFYTPAEISRILAQVIGITPHTRQDQTVYDPTCGSGSLLLKVADEAPNGITIYGQEKDNATAALARMNMILHNNPTAEIWQDDTLTAPHWREENGGLKRFDFAIANPPFSFKSWTSGLTPDKDEFGRFEFGIPPTKNGDYAFLLHLLTSLKSKGKGAIILPHGVLFRGNAEADIRRTLLKQGVIKGIIGLPANLFYGTGIPACIIVLDKEHAAGRVGIFMIDASKGFIKDGNKNRLRSRDINKIVVTFNHQLEESGYARMVSLSEIAKNDYNLNIPRYIDSSEPEDLHDLHAHLNGGIPKSDIDALEAYWQVFPHLRADLFASGEQDGYCRALVDTKAVRSSILSHPEFIDFSENSLGVFHNWQDAHRPRLMGLNVGDDPKALIRDLSEDLLTRFTDAPLLDKYAIYQILMDFWAETMQDDLYLIVQDGWQIGSVLRRLLPTQDKNGKKVYKETHDFEYKKVRYKADLIPPALIIARYFSAEQATVDKWQAEQDAYKAELESLTEEHGGDEGLLSEVTSDAGKVTKGLLKKRLKELEGTPDDDEELQILTEYQRLSDLEAQASQGNKAALAELDAKVFAHYAKLDVEAIKTLVVEDKWLTILVGRVQNEIERVTQTLANRIQILEERYAEPLPQIVDEVATLSGQVDEHLRKMGLKW